MEKPGIHCHRGASGCIPGIAPDRIVPDFVSSLIEISVQIAFKIPVDRICKVRWILGSEHKAVSPFDNLILQGSHVGCEHWETEAQRQKQDSTLIDIPVGQYKNVGRFEINLHLAVRNEFQI
jgi:hypothetical protein